MHPQPEFATLPPAAPRPDGRALVRERLAARKRRIRRLGRTVAGTSAAVFAAVWLVIYAQLASGHDPALTANLAAVAAPTSVATATVTPSSGSTTSTGTGSSSGSSTSTSTGTGSSSSPQAAATPAVAVAPAPMTTRQS